MREHASPVPQFSIILRAHNEEKHIARLLEGILKQSMREVEILLVDSGSDDATVAIARRYPVRILHISPEDFTFGRSLNLGCSCAKGDFVVMASAHVYPVYPDWTEQLLKPFHDPGVALVYGKQRGRPDSRFSERQILAKWFPDSSVARQTHAFCNNANAAIRRSLWLQHPYDEDLPGLEDLAWASWAIGQGLHLAYSAEAEVIHVHDETPGQVFNRYRREAMALRRIHPGEDFHLWDLVRLYVGNVISDAQHALQMGSLAASLREILWFRWMQFWGTYQGFLLSGPLTSQLKQTFYYPRGPNGALKSEPRGILPLDYGVPEGSPRRDIP
jgi:glycosyltransferase involved in cell wall biosynthesis